MRKKYVSSKIPHWATQLPYTNSALNQMGIACPKCCLERGRETQRAGIVLTREKKKQKQINPPDPSPSAL